MLVALRLGSQLTKGLKIRRPVVRYEKKVTDGRDNVTG
jgi:hypothetical protein